MQKQASLQPPEACWWSLGADAWWHAALPYMYRHGRTPEPQCSALQKGW